MGWLKHFTTLSALLLGFSASSRSLKGSFHPSSSSAFAISPQATHPSCISQFGMCSYITSSSHPAFPPSCPLSAECADRSYYTVCGCVLNLHMKGANAPTHSSAKRRRGLLLLSRTIRVDLQQ